VRGQLHASASLPTVPPGKGGWIGPRAGRDVLIKIKANEKDFFLKTSLEKSGLDIFIRSILMLSSHLVRPAADHFSRGFPTKVLDAFKIYTPELHLQPIIILPDFTIRTIRGDLSKSWSSSLCNV
jgi:hypothetical protein